jgi:hypothetical protein
MYNFLLAKTVILSIIPNKAVVHTAHNNVENFVNLSKIFK